MFHDTLIWVCCLGQQALSIKLSDISYDLKQQMQSTACASTPLTDKDFFWQRRRVSSLFLVQVYNILLQVTAAVQPVSCDEAYLDVTGLGDPQKIAASIRAEIQRETGCTASAGISRNMLLARLATKAGKPDGQYWLLPDQVRSYCACLRSMLKNLSILRPKDWAS